MNDNDKTFLGCVGIIFGLVGMIVVGAILKGWAIATLWAWFIAPVFSLPLLTVSQAIGVGLVVSMFTLHDTEVNSKNKSLTEVFLVSYAKVIFYPVMFVAFGYVLRMFV